MKPELVYLHEPRPILGEGPSWHAKEQTLWWIDIRGKAVHKYHPATKTTEKMPVDRLIGCLSPRTNGELIIAMDNGFYSLNPRTQESKHLLHPETHLPANRFNDGKVDPKGRFWAGTMDNSETGKVTGSLYMLTEDLTPQRMVTDIAISNGLAWNKACDTFYFIDSPTNCVDAFDYDNESGKLSNRRTVIKFDFNDGSVPDGMTIDNEGMLWIAHWGGSRVTRCNPDTGSILQTIEMPVSKPTSCCFGGKDLDELYITSASVECDTEKEPLAGGLFVVKNLGVRALREEREFLG